MQAACAARDFGTVLYLWRTHPSRRERLTQRGLAAAIGSISQSAISRIEKGELRVDRITDLQRWCSIIGLPAHLSWVGDQAGVRAQPSGTDQPAADEWDKREQAVAGHPLDQVTSGLLRHGRAGHYEAHRIAAETRRIRALDHSYGGRSVISLALANTARATHYLQLASTERARRPLLTAAAEAVSNTAWILGDAGDFPQAFERGQQALLMARESGSIDLELYAISNITNLARFSGDVEAHHTSLPLLTHAHRIAAQLGSPRLISHLLLREAQLRAAIGEHSTARHLLRAAEARLERSTTSDNDPAWLSFFADTAVRVAMAHVLNTTGAARDAQEMIGSARGWGLPEAERNGFVADSRLAQMALTWSQVEQACELGHALIEAAPDVDSWLVEQSLATFLRQATAVDSRQTRELVDHWRELRHLPSIPSDDMRGQFAPGAR